ncbi:hypothetical protein MSAN_00778800 [Mycena sanguinolenta]|uniref:Uncharacterized protein n=1 Tax=Mycena sanguinolenta TaxID=230812 RepID=A0A8H6Z914_9AGAR|nr:hypothetical protein MSAN_00778800 [Mycena sanguinolenta]
MPYSQAKHLQALEEYLEAVGVSDIKELPYGSGKPPVEEIMVGSMMDYFWAYKSGEPLAEVSNFASTSIPTPASFPTTTASDMSSLASTSYDSTSMADSVFYNLPSDSDLRAEFIRFNEKHHAIKRVSVEYFVFLVPGLQHELLPAALVRMFADFNVTLITGEGISPYIPAYYNYYAQALNDHDKSGNGWCYLQPGPHSTRLIFPDILLPADAASFLVRDHEITTRYLAPDMVAVSTFYYENAERLAQQELRRSVRYAKLRQEKKLLGKGKSFSVLDSQEAKARFAVKRKALDDAAAAADAADLRENGPEEGQIVPEVVMGGAST